MRNITQMPLVKGVAFSMVLCVISVSCYADVAVVVHPSSSIESLTTRQVKKLFLGRLRMLPNTGREAAVVDQDADSASHKLLYSKLINMTPVKLRRYRAAYLFSGKGTLPVMVKGDEKVKDFVADSLSAIGYIDAALVDDSVKSVYLLSID